MEFKKYDKIRIAGDPENQDMFSDPEDQIIIQEKLDGANFRFYITEKGRIIFGSRGQQLTSDDGEEKMQKNFVRCVNFVGEMVWSNIDISQAKEYSGLICFGECMVKHTMSYDWEQIPPFLGFDIFDTNKGIYLPFKEVCSIYEHFGLPMVPLVKATKVKDLEEINDDLVPVSEYSTSKAEGIVFKNYKKQLMSKFVREEFKEKNEKVFGKTKKKASDDEEYLVAVYCTNARIDKWIFKLVDEGNKFDMTLMHKLPTIVYKDIWDENYQEIYNLKNRTLNFGEFKKKVSHRCLEVLKQAIINNGLNK